MYYLLPLKLVINYWVYKIVNFLLFITEYTTFLSLIKLLIIIYVVNKTKIVVTI